MGKRATAIGRDLALIISQTLAATSWLDRHACPLDAQVPGRRGRQTVGSRTQRGQPRHNREVGDATRHRDENEQSGRYNRECEPFAVMTCTQGRSVDPLQESPTVSFRPAAERPGVPSSGEESHDPLAEWPAIPGYEILSGLAPGGMG